MIDIEATFIDRDKYCLTYSELYGEVSLIFWVNLWGDISGS